mmetsp:Transcript_3968/g.10046  ORF Transcript_3968/g.10046 Transcript_3968/m.10046 type:complete len:145 (-) Transcript_3968:1354-1788(-)
MILYISFNSVGDKKWNDCIRPMNQSLVAERNAVNAEMKYYVLAIHNMSETKRRRQHMLLLSPPISYNPSSNLPNCDSRHSLLHTPLSSHCPTQSHPTRFHQNQYQSRQNFDALGSHHTLLAVHSPCAHSTPSRPHLLQAQTDHC